MNYYKSSFISIFLLVLIIICIILIYNYGFSNVKNGEMNMNKSNIVKEGFKEGLNPSYNQVPNFFAEFGSDTSKTVFDLDGWGLYSNISTYGNEGLASLITSEPPVSQGTSGPRIVGFQGNTEVFITITIPTGAILTAIKWYGAAEYGPARNARDVEIYGVTKDLGNITYNPSGSNINVPISLVPSGWNGGSANGFNRLTNFTVPESCSLSNPSFFWLPNQGQYSRYVIRIMNNYGDSSVKVNCLGLQFNPANNISPPESTQTIRARKQAAAAAEAAAAEAERQRQAAAAAAAQAAQAAAAEAERQRQAAAAAEAKRVAALTDAKAAASAAITAADAAVSVANGGGSSQPEIDAKKAANDSKTAAAAASAAANSASTLQSAIDAKAAADKAKADANNAKSAANAAIAATAASSLAQKKAETKKNVDDALAIATQQITALNTSTSSTVANTETFIVNSNALSPALYESSSSSSGVAGLFDKLVRFFAPLREGLSDATDDLFANVKSKAASAQAIISKTSPPPTTTELTEALRLSLEALAEAQTIKTNLTACKASPRPTIKFNANTGVFPTAPAVPTDGSLYLTTESGKDYLILSKKDASSPAVSVESTLVYCARKDKFVILYNSDVIASRKFIQYKIKSVTLATTYVKYEVEIVSNTSGFTKANITNAQAVYISTSNALTQLSTSDGATAANPCAGPNPSANCKPVCIPTDKTTGAIVYKPDTTIPATIFTGKPLSYNNYYEYTPVRGIAGDGSAVYYPMDASKTFVGGGTDCLQECSEYDTGKPRAAYCKPSKGDRPLGGDSPKTGGTCMKGCIAVTDPTDRRNSSRCSYDKKNGYTCKAVCDFASGMDNCKINADCNDCSGDTYVKRFPIGWKPTVTRTIEQTYTTDQCKEKCKKPTKDTCLNFLQLEQGGGYLENKCRKVGKTKVICKPISQVTPNGLVAGYDGCSVCKTDTRLYGYFEYEKKWNTVLKQWDFKNIKEITSPTKSWFEGGGGGDGSGAGAGSGSGSGSGAGSGAGSGSGANLKGSKHSSYKEDKDTGDARDSKKTGELKSGDSSKSVSISSASQNAKRQEQSAKAAALKLKLDKLTAEYNDLVDSVKWNKLQMEKAEKDCSDINLKLKRAINDYATAETKSSKSGSTKKEKTDTEAANTLMYTIKSKAKEICNNYATLKDKYMKSVAILNALKNKRDDLKKQYDSVAADADSGSGFGSMLSPIINIFFGDDANRDCSGQLGCGNGIDYTYPSPFNSSKGGLFTPQPYYDSIQF